MLLRIAVTVCLCLLSMQAHSQRSRPATLSDAEWAEIDGLIHYPHPVRSVQRSASRSTLDGRLRVHLESEPYDITSDYQRFHFVNCSKSDAGWRCDEVQDAMRVRGMQWFVWLKSPIRSEEVVQIGKVVSAAWATLSPNAAPSRPLSLRTLEKQHDGRYSITASAEDPYCFSDIVMRRADDGTFSAISPIRRPSRCY
jgi:hypothetical protein